MMMLAIFTNMMASVCAGENVVVMTEKVNNPGGNNGDPHKGSGGTINAYQYGRFLDFGTDYSGNAVSLYLNDVVVYTTFINANGQLEIPETIIGTFELLLTVGDVIYSAYVTF